MKLVIERREISSALLRFSAPIASIGVLLLHIQLLCLRLLL